MDTFDIHLMEQRSRETKIYLVFGIVVLALIFVAVLVFAIITILSAKPDDNSDESPPNNDIPIHPISPLLNPQINPPIIGGNFNNFNKRNSKLFNSGKSFGGMFDDL